MPAAPHAWFPRRGEIYLAPVDPGKRRPVIVLSVDSLNKHALDVCVVPVTSVEHQEFSMRVPIPAGDGGLHKKSWAKCDQVTTLEKSFLPYPALGTLSATSIVKIEEQVKVALGLL